MYTLFHFKTKIWSAAFKKQGGGGGGGTQASQSISSSSPDWKRLVRNSSLVFRYCFMPRERRTMMFDACSRFANILSKLLSFRVLLSSITTFTLVRNSFRSLCDGDKFSSTSSEESHSGSRKSTRHWKAVRLAK